MSALSVPAVDHYFAYGSNMNPVRVRERGLRFTAVRGAWLKDRRLVFDKVSRLHPNAAHANVVYAPGERVEGVLYRLAGAVEILKMDPFERAPWNYGRDAVQVQAQDDVLWAWTYFANRAVRSDGLNPPAEYLAHMLAGRDHLSADYFDWLARTPVADCAKPHSG
ncbi:MAG: gamma-glutamylcyclotransferase [Gammaproteobacteria bacterium]|nr:gamma-glutamylcyclotransferase [Gammaproteobacteria bacterium]MDE0273100.1 gamma-glutamylcyclotransferase [Gammaproteobacteria bacterium]